MPRAHDRRHHRARPPAHRRGAEKGGGDEALGRSRGGLGTKIHALRNPLAFHLMGGQASDLAGADARVLAPLREAGKAAVIPLKRNRQVQREDDRGLYAARHLVENFFCRFKPFRGIAIRYDKTKRNCLAASVIPLNRGHALEFRAPFAVGDGVCYNFAGVGDQWVVGIRGVSGSPARARRCGN